MTLFSKILPGALLVLSLAACTAGEPPDAARAEAGDPAAGDDHVWKEQVETIDRAKSVEDTIKEADESRRKAMKDAGGG